MQAVQFLSNPTRWYKRRTESQTRSRTLVSRNTESLNSRVIVMIIRFSLRMMLMMMITMATMLTLLLLFRNYWIRGAYIYSISFHARRKTANTSEAIWWSSISVLADNARIMFARCLFIERSVVRDWYLKSSTEWWHDCEHDNEWSDRKKGTEYDCVSSRPVIGAPCNTLSSSCRLLDNDVGGGKGSLPCQFCHHTSRAGRNLVTIVIWQGVR